MKPKKIINIIITGGSGGIGSNISSFLIERGFRVINFDTRISKIKNIINIKCDLSKPKDIIYKFNIFKKKYKAINALINCAGVTYPKNILNLDLKTWNETISINLTAPFILSKLAAEQMILKKIKGSIINVTSISSDLPMPNASAYNVSKAGLKNLTKSLATDLATKGIRVNSLSPGYTKTPMTKKSWKNKKLRRLRTSRTLLNRWGEPNDYNEAILFLIDNNKAGYMTGSEIIIDGGWSIKGI